MSKPRTPPGLGRRGAAFWRSTVTAYELSETEHHLLHEACRCLDRLDVLDQAITELGPTVEGSQGQPVVNPALTEARGQQQVLHRLLAALALPDDEGQVIPTVASIKARKAADARWREHRMDADRRAKMGTL